MYRKIETYLNITGENMLKEIEDYEIQNCTAVWVSDGGSDYKICIYSKWGKSNLCLTQLFFGNSRIFVISNIFGFFVFPEESNFILFGR